MEYHINVVDGFSIKVKAPKNNIGWDVSITLKKGDEDYVESVTYKNISSEVVSLIVQKLLDTTSYNRECETESEAYAYLDILFFVENIISPNM